MIWHGARWLCLSFVLIAFPALAQTPVALENDYVRVSQDSAPCATPTPGPCEGRVILAMGDRPLNSGAAARSMPCAQIVLFQSGVCYDPPAGGAYFEVAVKP